MNYFTIWHILVSICAILIFILLNLLVYLNKSRPKNFYLLMLVNFLVVTIASIAIMLALDDKLKTAIITDVSTQRVYINETIVLKGSVKNTSKYNFSSCVVSIQMNSTPGKLQDFSEHLTKTNDFFSFLYKNEKEDSAPIKTSVNVDNIKPFELRPFSVILPYPPNFIDPKFIYKIKCR